MAKIKKLWLTGGILALLVFCCSRCMQPGENRRAGHGRTGASPHGQIDAGPHGGADADPRGQAYAGSRSCLECHRDIAGSWLHSAHALTSAPADSSSIRGPFAAGSNELSYGRHGTIVMQHRDSGYFQQAVMKDRPGEGHRFDITVGSGRKAQTYLYWREDTAFQLPVSYFVTQHSWASSPHYPADTIWFGRIVSTECFECHASYIQKKQVAETNVFHHANRFERQTLIYGIDCERCHGPAAAHVAWQEAHPADKNPKYITSIKMLSRQQRLDVCAVCHSGAHTEQRSLFFFHPGQLLADYLYAEPVRNPDLSSMDVHGNQYQLLTASQCFLKSPGLDCMTCHDPHVRERDDLAVFTRRCQGCHNPLPPHRSLALDSAALVKGCIDCHMPARASKVITMQTATNRDPVADLVRTHYIAVYR